MPARANIAAPRSAACQLLPVPTTQRRSPAASRLVDGRTSSPASRRSSPGWAWMAASSSVNGRHASVRRVGGASRQAARGGHGQGRRGQDHRRGGARAAGGAPAAACGPRAARRWRRTVVCEVAQQERLAALFGVREVGHAEPELAPGLFAVSVEPERAMHEWLRYQLRSGALAGLLGHSRLFHYLTAAAPGVTELVTMGKVWDLAQPERRTRGARFDTVIMDAPATGHALALLRAPRTYASVARVGPIARQATRIDAFLRDPSATGVLSVALPEEMPVNETVDLERRLDDELGMGVDRMIA